ncbi:MAG: hypothetical protein JRH20_30035 [Deltaproteobacteria bacterium]|nr:hypothetical protein [Deltaproteobacteria bacterium]
MRASTIQISRVLILVLPVSVFVGACNLESEKKIAALEKRLESLEKKNEQLERRLAHLGAERGPATAAPNNPLDAFGKILGQLGKMQPRPTTPRPPSGRSHTMDPALQKRVDKLMVDGLEKLFKSNDAKDLAKTLLKAMKRDIERQHPAKRRAQRRQPRGRQPTPPRDTF